MSLPSMLVMGGDKGYKGRCRRISQTPEQPRNRHYEAMTMQSFVTDCKYRQPATHPVLCRRSSMGDGAAGDPGPLARCKRSA